jgi:hypothetical protein
VKQPPAVPDAAAQPEGLKWFANPRGDGDCAWHVLVPIVRSIVLDASRLTNDQLTTGTAAAKALRNALANAIESGSIDSKALASTIARHRPAPTERNPLFTFSSPSDYTTHLRKDKFENGYSIDFEMLSHWLKIVIVTVSTAAHAGITSHGTDSANGVAYVGHHNNHYYLGYSTVSDSPVSFDIRWSSDQMFAPVPGFQSALAPAVADAASNPPHLPLRLRFDEAATIDLGRFAPSNRTGAPPALAPAPAAANRIGAPPAPAPAAAAAAAASAESVTWEQCLSVYLNQPATIVVKLHAALDIAKVRAALTAASTRSATAFTGRYRSVSHNHMHFIECKSSAERDAVIAEPLSADSIFKSIERWKPFAEGKDKETAKPPAVARKNRKPVKPQPKPKPKASDGNRFAALAPNSGSESDGASGRSKRKARAKPKPGATAALPPIPASPPAQAAAGTAAAHAAVSPNTLIKTVFDGVARTIAAAVAARPTVATHDSKGPGQPRDLTALFDAATNDDPQTQPRSRPQPQSQSQSKSKPKAKAKAKGGAAETDGAQSDHATDTETDANSDSDDSDSNDSAIVNAVAAAVASALRKAKSKSKSKGKTKSKAKAAGKGNAKL